MSPFTSPDQTPYLWKFILFTWDCCQEEMIAWLNYLKVTKLDAISVAEFGISVSLHRNKILLCVYIRDMEFTINNLCKPQVSTSDTKTSVRWVTTEILRLGCEWRFLLLWDDNAYIICSGWWKCSGPPQTEFLSFEYKSSHRSF